MKKFLLIDDHFVVRSGMQGLLSEVYTPCEIHEADDTESATEKLKSNVYDMIMLDVQMPNSDTLGFMEYVHIRYPDTKVLVFSMGTENIYAKRFLKAGAMGFLSKDAPFAEIKKAFNLVLSNRKYISEFLAQKLADDSFSGNSSSPIEKLSAREFEITSLLLSGQSVAEISKFLNVGPTTVSTYKTRIFKKLGVTNIMELKELGTSYNM